MFSTPRKLGEVTIFWLGMENEVWFENTRLRLIANLDYYVTAMLFLFQIHLLILWANSCTDVALRVGLVYGLGTPIEIPAAGARVYDRSWGILCDCVSLFQNYFLFCCIITKTKWSRRGVTFLQSEYTNMYWKRFHGISKNTSFV